MCLKDLRCDIRRRPSNTLEGVVRTIESLKVNITYQAWTNRFGQTKVSEFDEHRILAMYKYVLFCL